MASLGSIASTRSNYSTRSNDSSRYSSPVSPSRSSDDYRRLESYYFKNEKKRNPNDSSRSPSPVSTNRSSDWPESSCEKKGNPWTAWEWSPWPKEHVEDVLPSKEGFGSFVPTEEDSTKANSPGQVLPLREKRKNPSSIAAELRPSNKETCSQGKPKLSSEAHVSSPQKKRQSSDVPCSPHPVDAPVQKLAIAVVPRQLSSLEPEPTPLDAIIKMLQETQEKWREAESGARHAKHLQEENQALRNTHEADAKLLETLKAKLLKLEEQLHAKNEELLSLQAKLRDSENHCSSLESELKEGVIAAATHALRVLKSRVPDLDIRLLWDGIPFKKL